MARCRKCPAEVIFATTPTGKLIPLDVNPVSNGNIRIEGDEQNRRAKFVPAGEGTHVSHFVTCPNAGDFRRRK